MADIYRVTGKHPEDGAEWVKFFSTFNKALAYVLGDCNSYTIWRRQITQTTIAAGEKQREDGWFEATITLRCDDNQIAPSRRRIEIECIQVDVD